MKIERLVNWGGIPSEYYAGRLDGFRLNTPGLCGPVCKTRVRAVLAFITMIFFSGSNW